MADDPRTVLGRTIRARRLTLRLSQEALAERAELHWTYLGGVERGERNISLLNIVKIAQALNISAKELLKDIK